MRQADGNTIKANRRVYFEDGLLHVKTDLRDYYGDHPTVQQIKRDFGQLVQVVENLVAENKALKDENEALAQSLRRLKKLPLKLELKAKKGRASSFDKAYQQQRKKRCVTKNPEKIQLPITSPCHCYSINCVSWVFPYHRVN